MAAFSLGETKAARRTHKFPDSLSPSRFARRCVPYLTSSMRACRPFAPEKPPLRDSSWDQSATVDDLTWIFFFQDREKLSTCFRVLFGGIGLPDIAHQSIPIEVYCGS